jgi:hypothetical protein
MMNGIKLRRKQELEMRPAGKGARHKSASKTDGALGISLDAIKNDKAALRRRGQNFR